MNRFRLPALAFALLLAAPAHAASIAVEEAYAPPSLKGVSTGVAYVTIKNSAGADDTLLSAASPAAAKTELHTHLMQGDIVQMRQVKEIVIPAGQTVEMKPGGLHLMLKSLKKPLNPGDTVPITLRFKQAGAVTASAAVRPARQADDAGGHDGHHAHEGHGADADAGAHAGH